MKNKKHSHFYYLLPFSLWGTVLHSKEIDLSTRKRILDIIKHIIFREYCQLYFNHSQELSEKFSKNIRSISFYSKDKLRRMINTIIGLYYALKNYPEKLALNRISSHPIENTFGITRSTMQNKHGVDVFISSLSRNTLKNQLLNELKIELTPSRKASDACVFLNGREVQHVNFDVNACKMEINKLGIRASIANNMNYEYKGTQLRTLIKCLSIDPSLKIGEKNNNSISGSSIVARNIGLRCIVIQR